MKTAPIAGLVSKAKNSKPKSEGFPAQISGDHAAGVEYFANSLRDAERKVTGRSLNRVDARAQITEMIFDAFFSGSKRLEKKFDEDNSWIADLEHFTDWAALAAALPKDGEKTPEDQNSAVGNGPLEGELEGDSKNQESLEFADDEHGAGTHQANSEEGKGAAGSEEELSEMEKLEREMNAQNA